MPTTAYLGIDEKGKFQLYVSTYGLNVWGARMIKGRSAPAVVEEHQADPGNGELAARALAAANRYLRGEEFGLDAPVFGHELPKKRRKKAA